MDPHPAGPSAKPRGILKKTRPPMASTAVPAFAGASSIAKPRLHLPPARDKRREIAVHHATILQQRKDLESTVLDSLILLSEYPPTKTSGHGASNPAASDAAAFKFHIRLFQPGDYDDLVIERNVNGLCGYALCPNPKQELAGGAKWKLVNVGRENFGIVSKEEVEKWCCRDCRRRALWVRIQLTETAAWERAGLPDIQISLYGEDGEGETASPVDRTAHQLAQLRLDEQKRTEAATDALALERGDTGNAAHGGLVDVAIRDREVAFGEPSQDGFESGDHMELEGYKMKNGFGPCR